MDSDSLQDRVAIDLRTIMGGSDKGREMPLDRVSRCFAIFELFSQKLDISIGASEAKATVLFDKLTRKAISKYQDDFGGVLGKSEAINEVKAAQELVGLTDIDEQGMMEILGNLYRTGQISRSQMEDGYSSKECRLFLAARHVQRGKKTAFNKQYSYAEALAEALLYFLDEHVDSAKAVAIDLGLLQATPPLARKKQEAEVLDLTQDEVVPLEISHSVIIPDSYLDNASAELAAAVWNDLTEEERIRKITDPFPLPLRWANSTDERLADSWGPIRQVRGSASPLTLKGTLGDRGRDIIDIFDNIPSRRLVIVGQGGGGKTTLVMHFALQHIAKYTQQLNISAPIPVIFSLSSWKPGIVSLRGWMVDQLRRRYYRGKEYRNNNLAARLIESHRILPIFDGFDEIDPILQSDALKALNEHVGRGDQYLLTSRPEEYRAAVKIGDVLTAAAVVELEELTVNDLKEYLPQTTRHTIEVGNVVQHKWQPVLDRLDCAEVSDDQVAHRLLAVLSSPLMLSLARQIYSDASNDPRELLDEKLLNSPFSLESHLFDQYVKTCYDHFPQDGISRRAWGYAQAKHYLSHLAVYMHQLGGSRSFEPIPIGLSWAAPSFSYMLVARRFPWQSKSFLYDAYRRGVLRRSGTFYQFRHALLQDHLAHQLILADRSKPGRGALHDQNSGDIVRYNIAITWIERNNFSFAEDIISGIDITKKVEGGQLGGYGIGKTLYSFFLAMVPFVLVLLPGMLFEYLENISRLLSIFALILVLYVILTAGEVNRDGEIYGIKRKYAFIYYSKKDMPEAWAQMCANILRSDWLNHRSTSESSWLGKPMRWNTLLSNCRLVVDEIHQMQPEKDPDEMFALFMKKMREVNDREWWNGEGAIEEIFSDFDMES